MPILDELTIRITGDTAGFERSARKASTAASGMSVEIRRKLLPDLKSLAALALKGGGALAAIGAVKWGVKLAAEAQTARVAFKTLTGDVQVANKVLADIKTLAASTPLQQSELRDAGRLLLAFGTEASQVTTELRRLGDIGALTNNRIGDLAELYGKARVQGRLFAEDLNQLTGRGIPVLGELAKQFGVSAGEVKKLGSEGKITFANLEAAVISLTSEGGKFAGGLAAQSETLAGKWSTLKDKVGELGLALGENLVGPLTKAVDAATNLVALMGMMGHAFPDFAPPKAGETPEQVVRRRGSLMTSVSSEARGRALERSREQIRANEEFGMRTAGMVAGGAIALTLPSRMDSVRDYVHSRRQRQRQGELIRRRERFLPQAFGLGTIPRSAATDAVAGAGGAFAAAGGGINTAVGGLLDRLAGVASGLPQIRDDFQPVGSNRAIMAGSAEAVRLQNQRAIGGTVEQQQLAEQKKASQKLAEIAATLGGADSLRILRLEGP